MKQSKVLETIKYFKEHGYGNYELGSVCIAYGEGKSWWTNCAWCDVTVSAVLARSVESDADKELIKALGYLQATINTKKARKADSKYGQFLRPSETNIMPGDILFFCWSDEHKKNDFFDHTGIAISKQGSGKVKTFEGNAGSERCGYYVRDVSSVGAIIRPAFSDRTKYIQVTGKKNEETTKTWRKLLATWGYSNLDTSSGSIKAWQKHLKKYGYYNYKIDGEFGDKTTEGTKKLLIKKGFLTNMSGSMWKGIQLYLNDYIKRGVI